MLSSNKDLQGKAKKGYVVNLNNPVGLQIPALIVGIIQEAAYMCIRFKFRLMASFITAISMKTTNWSTANYEKFSNVIKSVHAQGGQWLHRQL